MSVRNILKIYRQATADELRAGAEWYLNAHNAARTLHADVSLACGVIAALSPGLKWEVNVEAARRVIAGESLKGLGVRWTRNADKARAIAAGKPALDVLKGRKVRAFYACMLNPTNADCVCVDGHAYAIWANQRVPTDATPNIGAPLYRQISAHYVRAAKRLGLQAHQIQAITWVVWRRLVGVAPAQ